MADRTRPVTSTRPRPRRCLVPAAAVLVGALVLALTGCGGEGRSAARSPVSAPDAANASSTATVAPTAAPATTAPATTQSTAPPAAAPTTAPTTAAPTTTARPAAPAPTTTRPPVASAADPDAFRYPMNGRVYVTLAWDCGGCVAELGAKHHPAIDYKSRDDDTIVAAGNGVVVKLNTGCASPSQGCGESMGNWVFLQHTLADGGTIYTFYAHLSEVDPAVRQGACIAAGARLGRMGNSGIASAAHLHFAFQTNTSILQYSTASSYQYGSRNPDDFYGRRTTRCG